MVSQYIGVMLIFSPTLTDYWTFLSHRWNDAISHHRYATNMLEILPNCNVAIKNAQEIEKIEYNRLSRKPIWPFEI